MSLTNLRVRLDRVGERPRDEATSAKRGCRDRATWQVQIRVQPGSSTSDWLLRAAADTVAEREEMTWPASHANGTWWKCDGRDEELYASDKQLFGTEPDLYRSDETLYRNEVDLYESDRLLFGPTNADGPGETSTTNADPDLYAIDRWLYASPSKQREQCTLLLRRRLAQLAVEQGEVSGCACSICLEDVSEGEKTIVLPKCGHKYHASCILQCTLRCWDCPVCRAPIASVEELQSSVIEIEKQKFRKNYRPMDTRYS